MRADKDEYDSLSDYADAQWDYFETVYGAEDDEYAHLLFDNLYKFPNEIDWEIGEYDTMYDVFHQYILENYDVVFDRDVWDWDDFRSWYDAA